MLKNIQSLQIFLAIIIQFHVQAGKWLGQECIPGMCSSLNSNCKWNGTLFKCVCKERFIYVNQTHCGLPLSNLQENKCRNCLDNDSLCIDFDNDDKTDECWCPKNEICEKSTQTKPVLKSIKKTDIEIEMIAYDVFNNKVVTDGSTVFVGDQLLFNIKTLKKDANVKILIENCSISALTNAEDIFIEKIDFIKKGCSIQNEINPTYFNFRSINENYIESNAFEIFKLRSSSIVLFNCWIQICNSKSKCVQNECTDSKKIKKDDQDVDLMNDEILNDTILKGTSIRLIVEDANAFQSFGSRSIKNDGNLPKTIELELKVKPFSGIIKSLIITAILVIFAILVSVLSILIYRACLRDQMISSSSENAETPFSMNQTNDDYKYDVNTRNLEESFFQNQNEHQQANRSSNNNSKWNHQLSKYLVKKGA